VSRPSDAQPPARVPGEGDDGPPVSTTRGEVRRQGVPDWLAALAGITAVLVAWFAISRPSVDTRTTDDPTSTVAENLAGATDPTETTTATPTAGQSDPDSTTSPASPGSVSTSPSGDDRREVFGEPQAGLSDLDTDGWRLLVGDGQTIVDVDLGSGVQTRHDRVGAPLAIVDDRLLVYRDPRLGWSDPDDLDQPTEEIIEVPNLQRMLTRGRPADRPVVVGSGADASIWWPNNNANPQTWTKVRLADGAVLDSIALTETVYGGPEVVATVGSGTFERVDGRWVRVGDLFASSTSQQAIVGQQCTQPDSCDWVLQRRGRADSPPERLSIPVGGPFDLRLVADADRILLRQSGGVIDHGTGRFVPVVGADAETMTAVNRSHLLAMADSANIGLRSALVTIVDLDASPDRSVSRIVIDDLVPRWLVLVPPATP